MGISKTKSKNLIFKKDYVVFYFNLNRFAVHLVDFWIKESKITAELLRLK